MPNVHVVAIHGEIDISQKQWIEGELSQIDGFGPSATTIVDLSDVRYLDTTFLNALCGVERRLAGDRPNSGLCVVMPTSNPVSRLFGITKLDAVFRLFEDMPSARRYIDAHPRS